MHWPFQFPSFSSAWDTTLFDEVERKLDELELGVDSSAESFVDDEYRPSKGSAFGGLANISDMGEFRGQPSWYISIILLL